MTAPGAKRKSTRALAYFRFAPRERTFTARESSVRSTQSRFWTSGDSLDWSRKPLGLHAARLAFGPQTPSPRRLRAETSPHGLLPGRHRCPRHRLSLSGYVDLRCVVPVPGCPVELRRE